ncbi:hypothetical protein [Umezawaea sp. Da 62-37]|uniref:hypothetical protein n=1 Tax=Umezawaea sp. Da 62-37 TaxID=3075927 RepID=UPI0028F6F47B|nr:hypothetical protein [Umezawaea sp. Da 62-37]WNV90907.1 hypothetical protein RM788_22290 [Umezawaea sp. Da 62-37]
MDVVTRQGELQVAADAIVDALGLKQSLAEFGEPVRVGSSALGLMVRRDIDITVVCPALDMATHEAVVELGGELARHDRVGKVLFRNDTGDWNTDPAYPDGFYLGVGCRSAHGLDWNLDIWFVDEPARQPDLEHVRTLPGRLTDETREAILHIKEAWSERPEYGKSVTGNDICTAVLDKGVRTPEEFERQRPV